MGHVFSMYLKGTQGYVLVEERFPEDPVQQVWFVPEPVSNGNVNRHVFLQILQKQIQSIF